MTPKGGVAKVTRPTFEAMGQIPAFHRTYFLLVLVLDARDGECSEAMCAV